MCVVPSKSAARTVTSRGGQDRFAWLRGGHATLLVVRLYGRCVHKVKRPREINRRYVHVLALRYRSTHQRSDEARRFPDLDAAAQHGVLRVPRGALVLVLPHRNSGSRLVASENNAQFIWVSGLRGHVQNAIEGISSFPLGSHDQHMRLFHHRCWCQQDVPVRPIGSW